ncbi:MAG: PilZ domain-containing protein [Bryobacterales bacterium]|nr:PilZ domain-containing protein [Bryobacterales bacterium]
MSSEKRRSPRAGVNKKLQVTYVDEQGRERFEVVPAQDVSKSGCRILLKYRCQPRTVVALSLTPANSGSATVRYQNPTPKGYITGLEFLGGLVLAPVA